MDKKSLWESAAKQAVPQGPQKKKSSTSVKKVKSKIDQLYDELGIDDQYEQVRGEKIKKTTDPSSS